jgi:hypothetical protein
MTAAAAASEKRFLRASNEQDNNVYAKHAIAPAPVKHE